MLLKYRQTLYGFAQQFWFLVSGGIFYVPMSRFL